MEHEEIYVAPRGAIWLAGAFTFYLDKVFSAVEFIHDQFQDHSVLDSIKSPEAVTRYANGIKETEPELAADLLGAVSHQDTV